MIVKKKTISEHDIQVQVVQWFDMRYKKYSGRLFAIPNGGKRHVVVASKMKKEGVRSGVPDLFLPVPSGKYHGLFIEMKSAKGRVSIEQSRFLTAVSENDYSAHICYSADDAIDKIKGYYNLSI